MTKNQARKILFKTFGHHKYKITRDDDIHVLTKTKDKDEYQWEYFGHFGEDSTARKLIELL